MANTLTPAQQQRENKRQHNEGYEYAMQFRDAKPPAAWLAQQIGSVATALHEYPALASGVIEPRQAYFAGLIEGYSTILNETVKGA